MLEKAELTILPWSPASEVPWKEAGARTLVRRILDAATGELLGFASWSPRGLLRFWRGLTIQVHEMPDASSLMTAHRPWGLFRMWQVHDAEETRVGTFYRDYLFDSMGYLMAALHETGRFATRSGVELGSWELRPEGCRLTFSNVAESSPFARMILLGKVLSMELPG